MNLREMKRKHFVETLLSKRIFRNYCIVLAAYALVMVAMAYLAYNVLQGRIWWPTDPLWPILHWLDELQKNQQGLLFKSRKTIIKIIG